ncbi:MAG: winged helix-turn-helix domain-containing protein [Pseudomonadota bacterium]
MSSGTLQTAAAECFLLGGMKVNPALGEVEGPDGQVRVEPKVMQLLICLCAASGAVVSRQQIEAELWGKDFIADDAVARLVSKLRKALGDEATAPRFIQTIPKRGYRIVAPVEVVPSPGEPGRGPARQFALVSALFAIAAITLGVMAVSVERGEPTQDLASYYYQRQTPEDMAQSAALFRNAVDQDPSNLSARVGLSSALVQSVLLAGADNERGLTASLQDMRHQDPRKRQTLEEALVQAEIALTLRSDEANAHKAKALALSALGRVDEAAQAYEDAVALNPKHWVAMLNLGELRQLQGDDAGCATLFERAFLVMQQTEVNDPEILARWGAPVAAHVANYYLLNGENKKAEDWFQSALRYRPLYDEASKGLELARSEKIASS